MSKRRKFCYDASPDDEGTPTPPAPSGPATVTATPGAGVVVSGSTVALACATAGAAVYYTTNGTDPNLGGGTLYAGPVTVTEAVTLKARAFDGVLWSVNLASFVYTVAAPAAVTAAPGAGELTAGDLVTLSCATAGAAIYYTTDGSDPQTSGTKVLYATPFAVAATQTVTAKATAHAVWSVSASFAYVVYPIPASVTTSPAAGNIDYNAPITLACATAGAAIYYTLDGSEPQTNPARLTYTAPFALATSATVKTRALLGPKWSAALASYAYSVYPIPADVTATPGAGEVASGSTVTLACTTGGAAIYYTTNGADPNLGGGTLYTAPVAVTGAVTFKTRAFYGARWSTNLASFAYTVTVASPVDTEIASWKARVTANGGTLSAGTESAALAWMTSVYAVTGLRAKLKRVNLFCGNNLAACMTPIIADVGAGVEENHGFVAGDYSLTTGLTGNGASYLNLGAPNIYDNAAGPGAVPRHNCAHFATWFMNAFPVNVGIFGAHTSSNNQNDFMVQVYGGTAYVDQYAVSGQERNADSWGQTFFLTERTTKAGTTPAWLPTNRMFKRNSGGLFAGAEVVISSSHDLTGYGVPPVIPLYLFAYNNQGAGPQSFTTACLGFYSLGYALDDFADDVAYLQAKGLLAATQAFFTAVSRTWA